MKTGSRLAEGLWAPLHGPLRPKHRRERLQIRHTRRQTPPPCPPRAQAAAGGPAASPTTQKKPATLAAAVETLRSRLEAAVLAEADEQTRQLETAYTRASDTALQREGIALLGLKASASGRLLSDMVWRLALPDPGAPLPRHKFRPGAAVNLRASGAARVKGLEAAVLEVALDHILVTVEPEVGIGLTRCPPGTKFRMEQAATDATTTRQLDALARLSQMPEASNRQATLVRAILLGSPKGAQLSAEPPEWAKSEAWRAEARAGLARLSGINDSQRKAVAAALTRCFTLWQGPPGTGKTRTLLAFLNVVCGIGATPGPALAVAETNTAADNLLAGLIERGVSAVRVGRPAQVRPELRDWCVDAVAERLPAGRRAAALRDQAATMLTRVQAAAAEGRVGEREVAQAQREAQRLWAAADTAVVEAAQAALRKCQVVVGTCASAGDSRLAETAFKLVVVDEATQATEPSALVALTKGAESVVMAGDHAQLPPTVLSPEAVKAGLGVPLFARLQAAAGVPSLLLSTQYRMHPAIADFPSKQFYKGCVASGVTAEERPLPSGPFPWPRPDTPVALLPCEGREERASGGTLAGGGGGGGGGGAGESYRNTEQAELAVRSVLALLADPGLASLAVLTPYTGQTRLLTAMLQEKLPLQYFDSGRVVVSTIDGFQGREAEAVVFSTVRSNPRETLGFLADARRMNVAITRAKRALVVIGSPRTLKTSSHWAAWLDWVRHHGAIANK